GLTVEQAGLSTIAPTRRTVRLTQLTARVSERARLLLDQCAAGVEPTLAAALVAAGPAPRGHSAARYHRHHRAARKRPRAARITVILHQEAKLTINDVPITAKGRQLYLPPQPVNESIFVIK